METLDFKIDTLINVNREMLAAIHRMGEVQALRIDQINKEMESLREDQHRASEAQKHIYQRIEDQKQLCVTCRAGCSARAGEAKGFDGDAWLGKKMIWVAVCILGPLLGFIGTKLAEKLLQ